VVLYRAGNTQEITDKVSQKVSRPGNSLPSASVRFGSHNISPDSSTGGFAKYTGRSSPHLADGWTRPTAVVECYESNALLGVIMENQCSH
jgi:hypothetical protein